MAVRSPKLDPLRDDPLAAAFHYEAAAEIAASLGVAGRKVETALALLARTGKDDPERSNRLNEAARAVHGYFIQRELVGLRRHDGLIREMGIPGEVLARLGAC